MRPAKGRANPTVRHASAARDEDADTSGAGGERLFQKRADGDWNAAMEAAIEKLESEVKRGRRRAMRRLPSCSGCECSICSPVAATKRSSRFHRSPRRCRILVEGALRTGDASGPPDDRRRVAAGRGSQASLQRITHASGRVVAAGGPQPGVCNRSAKLRSLTTV